MNRKELIYNIAEKMGFDKDVVGEFVSAYESVIYDAIRKGDSVNLYRFMKIERKTKKEYVGHGFGNNERKIIPAHDIVKIKPGVSLVECVSG